MEEGEPPASRSHPDPPGSARTASRRAILAGGVGGLVALGADLAAEGLIRTPWGPAPASAPYLLGAPAREPAAGLVRADLRAFKRGSGSNYRDAFVSALKAADAVYVPPGVWHTDRPVEVGAGKVLWSDAALAQLLGPPVGAVIQASSAMRATVLLTGAHATISGVTVDGAGLATSSIECAADAVHLFEAGARGGLRYALQATANYSTIWGGVYLQTGTDGYAVHVQGSDMIMWGSRVKRGQTPLWIDGSGGVFGMLHVTGVAQDTGPGSAAAMLVTGARNVVMDVYYDTAQGPLLLLSGGSSNRFVGMTLRNKFAKGALPAIRCDAREHAVQSNLFDGFFADHASGEGFSYLVESLGDPASLAGNILGTGHANGCRSLWNARPSLVGAVWSDGRVTMNAGTAPLGSGHRVLGIEHGLVAAPRSVSVGLSRGSAPRPDIRADAATIRLAWRSPPGPLDVYWQAEV